MARSQNIAVVGAGIMGLCVARALLHAGHGVTLYDYRGFPGDNASARAGAMLAPFSEIEHMPPAWIEAGLEGMGIWLEQGVAGFSRRGSLLVAHEQDRHMLERFRMRLPQDRSIARMLQADELAQYEPFLAGRFREAIFLPQEAHLAPGSLLSGLCGELARKGAVLRPEYQNPQRLGESCDLVLDCRGIGAAESGPGLRGVKGEMALIKNREFSLSRPLRLMHPRYPLYIVPRGDGMFMIGSTEIEAEEDAPSVNVRSALELLSAVFSLHPSFGEAQIIEMNAGMRPAYKDNLPRIRKSGNIIGCNGLYRHGFLLAPVMAVCVRDMIAGQSNPFTSLFMRENDDFYA